MRDKDHGHNVKRIFNGLSSGYRNTMLLNSQTQLALKSLLTKIIQNPERRNSRRRKTQNRIARILVVGKSTEFLHSW